MHAVAQAFNSDKRFDLIVMTGHAFQVFLDDKYVAYTCAGIRSHLDEDGIFEFETRNPAIDRAHKWDGICRELKFPEGAARESFKVLSAGDGRIVFQTEYTFSNKRLISVSELRVMSLDAITRHLPESGLAILKLFGD